MTAANLVRSAAPSPIDARSMRDAQATTLASPGAFGLTKSAFPLSPSVKDDQMASFEEHTRVAAQEISALLKQMKEIKMAKGQSDHFNRMIRKLGSAEIVFVRNCRKEIALFDKWAQEAKAGQVFDTYHKNFRQRICTFIQLIKDWQQEDEAANLQELHLLLTNLDKELKREDTLATLKALTGFHVDARAYNITRSLFEIDDLEAGSAHCEEIIMKRFHCLEDMLHCQDTHGDRYNGCLKDQMRDIAKWYDLPIGQDDSETPLRKKGFTFRQTILDRLVPCLDFSVQGNASDTRLFSELRDAISSKQDGEEAIMTKLARLGS